MATLTVLTTESDEEFANAVFSVFAEAEGSFPKGTLVIWTQAEDGKRELYSAPRAVFNERHWVGVLNGD